MWDSFPGCKNFRTLDQLILEFNKENEDSRMTDIYEVIDKIVEELEILELGLDYKRYQKYNEFFNYQINEWTLSFDVTDKKSSSIAHGSLKNFLKRIRAI